MSFMLLNLRKVGGEGHSPSSPPSSGGHINYLKSIGFEINLFESDLLVAPPALGCSVHKLADSQYNFFLPSAGSESR